MKAPRPGVNRRDLLRFRRNKEVRAALKRSSPGDPGRYDLIRVHRPAMGSYFEVRLPASIPGAVDLACRGLDVIELLEAQMTVYRDDSEVSRLNATAHRGPVAVERGLFELLEMAVGISRETGGAYDVAAGALSEAWGFVKGPKQVPDEIALANARARTGWHHLQLDSERHTVAFDREGVRINLGSIGKGFAIDRAVDVLRAHWWPVSALIHGGQSSLYALGSPPGQFGDRWEIALRNPFEPELPLGTLRLRNRGLGTSGAAFQQFVVDGRVYGHIIDPRSGEPAIGPASVTVLAPTAALADALSTAFYLLGPEAAAPYVAQHPEVGVVFVDKRPEQPSPCLLTFGLDDHDFVVAGNTVH
ncbi:MAG TPA: FAD:protein FMN transferase [Isosphaeraceae bacterium]|nr:FAD:protein FMN transferase [Isosphaeraceae bacterium]